MSIIGNIGGQSGGGSLTKSILIVAAPTGSTVTVTKGSTTKTAIEKNGEWWFKGLENGEWTIRAELDGQSATVTYNITQFGVYRKPISYRMTPEFTYTGDYEIVQDDDTPIADFASWKGNWKIRFLTSGDFKITKMHGFSGEIDVFLVGGGGSGSCGAWSGSGYDGRGGGGGGYTTTANAVSVPPAPTTYQIVVGAGGTGATVNTPSGNAGGESNAFDVTAAGGAGGGHYAGGAGGSGGGAGAYERGKAAGAGGSDGSNGGSSHQSNGSAGQGTTTREFGESNGRLYAGGGGGGHEVGTIAGAGGKGGGGAGGGPKDPGSAGTANTGGGSGGTAYYNTSGAHSQPGGSGIVIIRNAREVAQ